MMVASSSSSSSSTYGTNTIPEIKYDVFLNFRGKDTRNNFISHLYAALCREHIHTFVDNQLIKGEEISQSLLNAIERSSISVIIFSKCYASSEWCLDELIKILECKNKYGQIVIPVFYHISPSDVRNQTGDFGNSFSKLAERFKERIEKLRTWSSALTEAANLSGFASHVIRYTSRLNNSISKVQLL